MIRLYFAIGLLKTARHMQALANTMIDVARGIINAATRRAHEKAH